MAVPYYSVHLIPGTADLTGWLGEDVVMRIGFLEQSITSVEKTVLLYATDRMCTRRSSIVNWVGRTNRGSSIGRTP